jgi:ssDNA-binding Zn-finger/Zn-ribbon topoisomerase 1
MKMKTQPIRTYGTQQRQSRGKFIAMSAYIKNRKISNKQPNALELLEKQEKTKPKIRKGEIIKIRAKINEIETKKKKYKESTKQIAGSLKE